MSDGSGKNVEAKPPIGRCILDRYRVTFDRGQQVVVWEIWGGHLLLEEKVVCYNRNGLLSYPNL